MTHAHTYLINGVPDQSLSPFDRGLSYGDGVFRTMKVEQGQVRCWDMHYAKLVQDCATLGIVCPDADLLQHDLASLFAANESGAAKIVITRGESTRGYAPPSVSTPTRIVSKSSMPVYADRYFTEGVSLHVCETRLAAQPRLAGVKHLNRLENVLARMEWQDDTIFDGLLLDQQDHVIEGTMSNIFARYGDTLVTPALDDCGVAGITRQRILNQAKTFNLLTEVKPLSLPHLLHADEILICNSLFGAFQVTRIDNHTWAPQLLATQFRNLLACSN